MLIGVDASRSSPRLATGTERYSLEVINALGQRGNKHKFRLYFRNSTPPVFDFPHESVRIGTKRLWTHIGLGPELLRNPPDAMYIPAHVLPIGLALHRQLKTVVTIHDIGYMKFPEAHPLGQRIYLHLSTWLSASFATHISVISHATKRNLIEYYKVPENHISVAYPGFMPPLAIPIVFQLEALSRLGLVAKNYAVYIGTLQPRKNLARLIKAWTTIVAAFPDNPPKLVIVGKPGWGVENYAVLAQKLGLESHVIFTGFVSEELKSALLRNAGCLAYPSLHEGFGFPIVEAQSVGTPVLCSNTSSMPEVAGDSAVLVNPEDTSAIANGLVRIFRDPSLSRHLSEIGLQNSTRFTWSSCAATLLELLNCAH